MKKSISKDLVIDFLRGEFIGKEVEIVESRNKDLAGIKGKIVDETKNMFEIETKKDTHPSNGAPSFVSKANDASFCVRKMNVLQSEKEGTKKVQKKVCKFKFLKEKIMVDGVIINYRPEDRISRKFRDW